MNDTKRLMADTAARLAEAAKERDRRARSLTPHQRRLCEALEGLRVEDLKLAWQSLDIGPAPKLQKVDLVLELALNLSWPDETVFRLFFSGLSPLARDAIERGAFERFVDADELSARHRVRILERAKRYNYEYSDRYELADGLGLGFFRVYDGSTIFMLEPFRLAFAAYLPKPAGYNAEPLTETPRDVYNNEEAVFESLPLALMALGPLVQADSEGGLARKGLGKAKLKELRAACAYKDFPAASAYGLDSLELLARFLSAMTYRLPKRRAPPDAFEFLRSTIATFLGQPSGTYFETYARGQALEHAMLIDHLSRKPGCRVDLGFKAASRETFSLALRQAAAEPAWLKADDVVRSLGYRALPLGFLSPQNESYSLCLKGESLSYRGRDYGEGYSSIIDLEPILHDRLVAGPLFKAYCYLMAALGIVEIAEREPPLDLTRKGKAAPVCAYDCLYAFRVTALGRYVLGLAKEKPAEPERVYEAIADPELPLVAFRGRSLERRLFLESIGEPLGSERFRVTVESLCSGCADAKAVAAKAADFRRLICDEPAPHWERLFSRAEARAASLGKPSMAYVFKAPADREAQAALLESPALRRLFSRAEGGLIVVRGEDYKKFLKAAWALGYRPGKKDEEEE